MAAAAQAEAERAMLDKLWRQRLERARYAAGRARRQYQLAEPENRLVARQLETDWEAALAEADRLEADYQRFTEELPKTLTAAERAAIQALASDLPRVWDAPSTTQADRKELLRILIEEITVGGRREQRAGRRHHHLGRRPPDHRAGRPPRRPPGPAVLLPRPPRPRHRARRKPAVTTARSPASSTPRDSGRPSGPAGSPAGRSAP